MSIDLTDSYIKTIQNKILAWYAQNGRTFPWRETSNPFFILLSEKLLQQTSVRTDLITAYKKITSIYPTVYSLSIAQEEDVKEIIKPLGLSYRARELSQLSKEICLNYGGKVPDDLDLLKSLPGVGEYSARAILCFAFKKNVSIVDTNIARFYYRILDLRLKFPPNPARNKIFLNISSKFIPSRRARDFNWGLLDFCSLVCTAKKPHCRECPILSVCNYSNKNIN